MTLCPEIVSVCSGPQCPNQQVVVISVIANEPLGPSKLITGYHLLGLSADAHLQLFHVLRVKIACFLAIPRYGPGPCYRRLALSRV